MLTARATDVKNKFGQYLERALVEPVIVEKTNRQVAVLISMEEYRRLMNLEDAYWGQMAATAEAEGYASEEEVKRLMEKGAKG